MAKPLRTGLQLMTLRHEMVGSLYIIPSQASPDVFESTCFVLQSRGMLPPRLQVKGDHRRQGGSVSFSP